MRHFEIIPTKGVPQVLVQATTKAGLVGAALQGLFSVTSPDFSQAEDDTRLLERSFKIEADGFADLLAALLNDALRQAAKHGEAYEEVRLNLITDKKAEGEYLGRTVRSFGRQIKGVKAAGLEVQRNEAGEWQTTLTMES